MRKIIVCLFSVLSLCAVQMHAQDELSFEKDGFGVSIQTDFNIEKETEIWEEYNWRSSFDQRFVTITSDFSIGATALYTWHPVKNGKAGAKLLFLRFGLGGEFNRYGENNSFLFNTSVMAGYTIKVSKVGIDIFTGPAAKFAPYKRSGTKLPAGGPWEWGDNFFLYTGGLAWRFGIGFNYRRVGLFVAYNQKVTKDFEHYKEERLNSITEEGPNFITRRNTKPMLNSMTVGLTYRF